MSEWQSYIDQIVNKMDYNTNEFSVTGICDEAAIYGHDGSAWAWSPGFPELKVSSFTVEGMTAADTKTHQVDEFQCALKAADGNRNPSEAGIILGGEKYMFTSNNDGLTQLSRRGGGGASLMKTNTALVIAFWKKDKPFTGGKNGVQNAGDCAMQVEAMAKYLIGLQY